MPAEMSLFIIFMFDSPIKASNSASSPPCSLTYAAVESARTGDDASYRIHSQIKAEERTRPVEEGVG